MPIYQLLCRQCQHRFEGMVFAGTRLPEKWVCPNCHDELAEMLPDCPPAPHPLEDPHGAGCPCCGGNSNVDAG